MQEGENFLCSRDVCAVAKNGCVALAKGAVGVRKEEGEKTGVNDRLQKAENDELGEV